ncbi:MAG: sterol desaturase family protein [Alphaproteobacteria bacterium]|nr:sterol desaturase family protein [Alphaproteobacteria bacterium]
MMDAARPGLFAFPVFLVLIALEAWWLWARRGHVYPWRDSLTSLAIAAGHKLSSLLPGLVAGPLYFLAWKYRLATVPLDTWWGVVALFFGVEFFYYWFHRYSHECRWLWATHAVHHSPQQLNFAAAYRLGWTGVLSGNWVFWLPLAFVGFDPAAVFLVLGLNLVYQFFLHTELIGRLGPIEWFFNTPSHHRVHHATNPAYLDRNYGGVVIIFDRLFGTFVAERADEPCRYGLVHPVGSLNPFKVAFHEWVAMGRDVKQAVGWRARGLALFGPPGGRPARPALAERRAVQAAE